MLSMSSLDQETVRRAVAVARARGLARIKVAVEGGSVTATLSPDWEPTPVVSDEPSADDVARVAVVTAPVVGYFRAATLAEGDEIEVGQSVGEVVALGISNEVPSTVSGVFERFLAEDESAVEFGQGLARIMEK